MSNTQFEIDNKISTITTPAGHLDQTIINDIIGTTQFITVTESGTIPITINGDTVLDFDATIGTPNSNYYTFSGGVTTIIRAGTYEINYNVILSADTTSGNTVFIDAEQNGSALLKSSSRLLLATTVANDVYTLTGSAVFTAAAGDTIRIVLNKSDANNMTVEILSGYQIKTLI